MNRLKIQRCYNRYFFNRIDTLFVISGIIMVLLTILIWFAIISCPITNPLIILLLLFIFLIISILMPIISTKINDIEQDLADHNLCVLSNLTSNKFKIRNIKSNYQRKEL